MKYVFRMRMLQFYLIVNCTYLQLPRSMFAASNQDPFFFLHSGESRTWQTTGRVLQADRQETRRRGAGGVLPGRAPEEGRGRRRRSRRGWGGWPPGRRIRRGAPWPWPRRTPRGASARNRASPSPAVGSREPLVAGGAAVRHDLRKPRGCRPIAQLCAKLFFFFFAPFALQTWTARALQTLNMYHDWFVANYVLLYLSLVI